LEDLINVLILGDINMFSAINALVVVCGLIWVLHSFKKMPNARRAAFRQTPFKTEYLVTALFISAGISPFFIESDLWGYFMSFSAYLYGTLIVARLKSIDSRIQRERALIRARARVLDRTLRRHRALEVLIEQLHEAPIHNMFRNERILENVYMRRI